RAVQRRLGGAQVLGNPIGALGHARVAGGLRLAQIVGQGDVEAPALAGQVGGEQGEQGVRGERGVLDRFLGRGVRLGGVVGGGGQCLAAQEQQAGQQRDEYLHEGVTHLLCAIMTQACRQAHRRRRVSGSCSNIGDIGQL